MQHHAALDFEWLRLWLDLGRDNPAIDGVFSEGV